MHIDSLYRLIGAIVTQSAVDAAGVGPFMQAGDQESALAFLDDANVSQVMRDRIVANALDRRRTASKPGGARKHLKIAA